MAYRDTEMGLLMRLNPAEGRARIIDEYRKAGANLAATAKSFEVDERTLRRWIERDSKLDAALTKLKTQALKEGWHHDHSRQGGRPKEPRSRRKERAGVAAA